MTRRALNEELLPENPCFGCGLSNERGLKIRIYRDAARDDHLVGEYQPQVAHEGFPSIVHGGVQFTALDCMAAWIIFGLRSSLHLMPLTQSAQIKYHRPVGSAAPLLLNSTLVARNPAELGRKAVESWRIETTLTQQDGTLLTSAGFDYVVVPSELFCTMVGLKELPDSFKRHFRTSDD